MISKGQLTQAEDYAEKAVQYLNQIGDDTLMGDKLCMNAYRLYYLGNFEDSLDEFNEIINITDRTEYISHRCMGLAGRTINMIYMGQVEQAIDFPELALDLADKGSDQIGQVVAFGLMSKLYYHIGFIEKLRQLFDDRFEDIIGKSNPAIFMMYAGYMETATVTLEMLKKDPDNQALWAGRAKKVFGKLRRFANLFPMAQRARLRLEGQYAILNGDIDKGFEFFEQSLNHEPSAEMVVETALTHYTYARYADQHDRPNANDHYTQAETFFAQFGMEDYIAYILHAEDA